MLRTFGILSPRPARLESWQRRAVLDLLATNLSRLVAWRANSSQDWPEDEDSVQSEDLLPSNIEDEPDFWLCFGPVPSGKPVGEVWTIEGCPLRAYAGEGWLQEIVLHDGERTLHRARIRIHPDLGETCRRWHTVASSLPARALAQVATMGAGSFEPWTPLPASPVPGVMELLRRRMTRFFLDKVEDLFAHDVWNVGVTEITWSGERLDAGAPRWLPPCPELRYVADPFPLNDLEYLVEDFGYGRGSKGRIARIGAAGMVTVIEEPFHLSYPALVRDGEELYCVPESHRDRSCRLYRSTGDRWVFEGTIMEGIEAVDPTLFIHDGRWWLFCSDPEDGGFCRLSAYHAPAIRGPWTPHALNPLKRDLRGARPAGPVFLREGTMMRPGQDCTRTYGGGVILFRIDELSPTSFCETEIQQLLPFKSSPYPDGLHHVVVEPHRIVLDGKRRIVDPLFWLKRLLRKS